MQEFFSTLFNVMLMIAGFGLVIVVHELGHFLAARWAGVRVHAFAVGFGAAILSWRKGLGLRVGSSEPEYLKMTRAAAEASGVSPTEYRLNWFPFGGYVKMLGQEDLAPIPALTAKDSFAAQPVWKRMIIMTGGVFMNLVLAGVLFVAAYTHGIDEVAPIVGEIAPGSPAEAGGLRAGDRVYKIDGERVSTFMDLQIAAAMGSPETPVRLTVGRRGVTGTVDVEVIPRKGAEGMLEIGVAPAPSSRLSAESELGDPVARDVYARLLQEAGLGAVQPGMTLVRVNDEAVAPLSEVPQEAPTAESLRAALESSGGSAVRAVFADKDGREVEASLRPEAELQAGLIKAGAAPLAVRHLLGLVPVMRVASTPDGGTKSGLLPGDVFARIGRVEWPSVAAGIAEVRENKGKSLDIVVLRDGVLTPMSVAVSQQGRIGFIVSDTSRDETLLASNGGLRAGAAPTSGMVDGLAGLPALQLQPGIVPGSRVVSVEQESVRNFLEMRTAIVRTIGKSGRGAAVVRLGLELPIKDASGERAREEVVLTLSAADIEAVRGLGWDASRIMQCFDFATFADVARSPWEAISKGVDKTKSTVLMTYATFLRLFRGTVPVDQLHGPVGITHLGSRVAERGFFYLIFFLGLISANLAVINFLPLPIVDGGHMVFLAIEGITRRPVSAAVQNVSIIVGLVIVGGVFLIVTYHDFVRLFG